MEENDRLDTPHGPVTSSFSHTVPTTDQCRERTSSVTSEVCFSTTVLPTVLFCMSLCLI